MRILFLTPYPFDQAPSQRYRFEQYYTLLKSKKIETLSQSFITLDDWNILYKQIGPIRKSLILFRGFLKRIVILPKAASSDFVFIHREVMPFGPPIFEWMIAKILRRKIIYDFDDAIWLTDKQNESWPERMLKFRSKVGSICKWSWRVSAGNSFLAEYAKKFNPRVVTVPTTIDTSYHHNITKKEHNKSNIIIGWTGSHSTLKYLNLLTPVLKKLEKEFPQVTFLVIADQPPSLELQRLQFIKWSKESEISDLSKIDIGVMPLPDDEWSKGKCGFKAIQYMAMGIPSVASPVGVNTTLIQHAENGYLCNSDEEWFSTLGDLIRNTDLREKIGKSGKEKISKHYSLDANISNFFSLFE